MSTAMNEQTRVTPKDFGRMPRKVSEVLCDLVNNYGVQYRVKQDHVFLYNGKNQERPWKISPSRPAEASLNFLQKWIKENVPTYYDPKPKAPTPEPKPVISRHVEPKMDAPSATEGATEGAQQGDTQNGRKAYIVPSSGRDSGFDYDGETFFCRDCDYIQTERNGLHLHRVKHEMTEEELARKRQERISTRTLRAEQRKAAISQAVMLLADTHGLKLVDPNETLPEVAEKDAEIARLKSQVADLEAKLALIKEAMKA